MNPEDMEFWERAAAKLRQAYKHTEMTPEEIEAFLDTAEDESLPEGRIEEIVASIRAGLMDRRPSPHPFTGRRTIMQKKQWRSKLVALRLRAMRKGMRVLNANEILALVNRRRLGGHKE